MANNEVIELAIGLTPGEHFQNWLARRGIGEPVGERTLYQPEPPGGVWILINGGIAIASFAAFVGMIGVAVFQILPALANVAVL